MYTYCVYIIFVLAYTERKFIAIVIKAYSPCYYSKFHRLFYRQQKRKLVKKILILFVTNNFVEFAKSDFAIKTNQFPLCHENIDTFLQ